VDTEIEGCAVTYEVNKSEKSSNHTGFLFALAATIERKFSLARGRGEYRPSGVKIDGIATVPMNLLRIQKSPIVV
jgi:hypothetical protein